MIPRSGDRMHSTLRLRLAVGLEHRLRRGTRGLRRRYRWRGIGEGTEVDGVAVREAGSQRDTMMAIIRRGIRRVFRMMVGTGERTWIERLSTSIEITDPAGETIWIRLRMGAFETRLSRLLSYRSLQTILIKAYLSKHSFKCRNGGHWCRNTPYSADNTPTIPLAPSWNGSAISAV